MKIWVINSCQIQVKFEPVEFRAIVTESRRLDRSIQWVIKDGICYALEKKYNIICNRP